MRKLLVVLLMIMVVLAMVACDQEDEVPTDQDATTVAEEAPRIEVTPTPTLPATYTPAAMGRAGHLFAVSTRTIHVVQPGDTLGGIARQYGLTYKAVADANRIYNYDLIEVGDVLYIPPCE